MGRAPFHNDIPGRLCTHLAPPSRPIVRAFLKRNGGAYAEPYFFLKTIFKYVAAMQM